MKNSPLIYYSPTHQFKYDYKSPRYATKVASHTHTNYEIYYFLGGDITYFVEGTHYTVQPHDILITNHRELHCPLVNLSEPYARRFIQFERDFLSPSLDLEHHLLSPLDNRPLGHLNKIDKDYVLAYGIDQLFDTFENRLQAPDKYTDFEAKLLLNQILILIKRIFDTHMDATLDQQADEKIYHIIKFINENISSRLLLEDIANEFFMNKYYLCHLFKKHTGFSIKEYITSKRIMRAKELIAQGVPITSICYDVGFNDYSCFYKAFTKLENKSPKAFLTQSLRHTSL